MPGREGSKIFVANVPNAERAASTGTTAAGCAVSGERSVMTNASVVVLAPFSTAAARAFAFCMTISRLGLATDDPKAALSARLLGERYPSRHRRVFLLPPVLPVECHQKADRYRQRAQARSIPSLLRLRSWRSDELHPETYSEVDKPPFRSLLGVSFQRCNELSSWNVRSPPPGTGVRSRALARLAAGLSERHPRWHRGAYEPGPRRYA